MTDTGIFRQDNVEPSAAPEDVKDVDFEKVDKQ